jgi:hypothetical protein
MGACSCSSPPKAGTRCLPSPPRAVAVVVRNRVAALDDARASSLAPLLLVPIAQSRTIFAGLQGVIAVCVMLAVIAVGSSR